MVWEKTHHSGAEEWHCPTCGRCLLVTRKPKYMEIVREPGNEYAFHSGSKDSLQGGPVQVLSVDDIDTQEQPYALLEERRLAPWLAWMEVVGFENFWNDNVQFSTVQIGVKTSHKVHSR